MNTVAWQANAIVSCLHENVYVCHSPTTNYPRPAIYCHGCHQKLMTLEKAKEIVEQAAALGIGP